MPQGGSRIRLIHKQRELLLFQINGSLWQSLPSKI
jgi:hypothetical protein